jgi:hypothetical protein
MPISVSPSGAQMNDGNTLSRGQTAALLPDQMVDTGSLLIIDGGISLSGDAGITSIADPSFSITRGDNVYTNYAVINATSSWTVPTGVSKGYVMVIGGGGSGGNGVSVPGSDSPGYSNGGNGGLGGIAASFIPLLAGNSMPATVGAATGTTTFFGISATGGTNGAPGTAAPAYTDGAPGTPGTSSTGNLLNGNIGSIWPIPFITANAYGVAKSVTPQMNTQGTYNSSVPGGGLPAGTLYGVGNTAKAGAGGTGGVGSIGGGTPAGAGLPGAVIIFY